MVAVELVEPLNVAILPLAFLALGAATAVRSRPAEHETRDRFRQSANHQDCADYSPRTNDRAGAPYALLASLIALALALFLGVTMVAGDAYMFHGTNSGPGRPYNLAAAKDANRLLPYWPDPALELAQIKAFDSLNSVPAAPADLAAARQWTAVAVSRDPKNPALWTLLAGAEVDIKAYVLARTDYDRVLSCDKWYTQALQGLAQLAETDHDWSRAVHFYRLALTTAVNDGWRCRRRCARRSALRKGT